MLKNLIITSLRNLAGQKIFSIINIFGLALGAAGFFLISLFISDELSYDRFHNHADDIYRVVMQGMRSGNEYSQVDTWALLGQQAKENIPEIENYTRLCYTPNMLMRKEQRVYNETGFYWADSSFFQVFTFPLIYGSPEECLKLDHKVVLTEEACLKLFDSLNVIGQTIYFEDSTEYEITGVAANPPTNSHFSWDMLASNSSTEWSAGDSPLWNNFKTYLLLRSDCDINTVNNKLQSLAMGVLIPALEQATGLNQDELTAAGNSCQLSLQPLTSIHLHSHHSQEFESNSDIRYIYIFSAIAVLIIFVAGFNFTNLSTARAGKRSREVGVRKVLGADRKSLIVQFIGENLVLSLVAFFLALIMVELFLPIFAQLTEKQVNFHIYTRPAACCVLLLITLLSGILAGVYPAFMLSGYSPVSIIKGKIMSGRQGSKLRNVLVILQFAVSVFLIICTIVIYRQMKLIQQVKIGFDREQVLVIKRGWATENHQEAFLSELTAHPSIISASGCSSVPGQELDHEVLYYEGNPENKVRFSLLSGDNNYPATLNIQMVEGEYNTNQNDSFSVIINETAVRALGIETPVIGKRIRFDGNDDRLLISGVIKDFNYESLRQPIKPLIMYYLPWHRAYTAIKIAPGNPESAIKHAAEVWAAFVPDKPFEYFFLDESMESLYKEDKRTGNLIFVFALNGIIIASLGLFGLAGYMAERRYKEIGIRKALGAHTSQIMSAFFGEFLKWVIISNLIAWPCAWLVMKNWLAEFVYKTPLSPDIFIIAGTLAVAISFLSVFSQAIQASSANPIDILKYE